MPGALDGAGVDGGVYVDFQRIFADAILYVAFECVVILVQLSTIHFERFYRAEGHRGRMDAVCIGRAVDVIRNIPSVDQFKFDLIFWNICNVDFGDLDGDVRGFDVGIRGGVLTVLHVFVAEENAVSVPADGKARGQGIGCALILNFRKTLAAIADQSLRVIFMNKEPTHIEVFRRASAACGQRDVLRLAVLLASGVCDQADRGVDGNFRDGDIVCDVIHTIEIVPAASGFVLVVACQQRGKAGPGPGGREALFEGAPSEDVGNVAEAGLLLEHAAGEFVGLCAHGECAFEDAASDRGASCGDVDCFLEGAAADSELILGLNGAVERAAVNDEFTAGGTQRVSRLTREASRSRNVSAFERTARDDQLAIAYAHGVAAAVLAYDLTSFCAAGIVDGHSPEGADREKGASGVVGTGDCVAVQIKGDGKAFAVVDVELFGETSHVLPQLDGAAGGVGFGYGRREVGVEVGCAVHRQRGDCIRLQIGAAVVALFIAVCVLVDSAFHDRDVWDLSQFCNGRYAFFERPVILLESIARRQQGFDVHRLLICVHRDLVIAAALQRGRAD